jgi:hypothetical protein
MVKETLIAKSFYHFSRSSTVLSVRSEIFGKMETILLTFSIIFYKNKYVYYL